MNTKISELTLAEKLLISGNILGSISMALISIGAILRTSSLPDTPLFDAGTSEKLSNPRTIIKNNNQSNYWEK